MRKLYNFKNLHEKGIKLSLEYNILPCQNECGI